MSGSDQQSKRGSSTPGGDGRGRARIPGSRRGFAVAALLLVVVGLLSLVHITRSPAVSPFDEFVHFDTLEKNSRFVLIGRGEHISQITMREVACHGMDLEWTFDSCDAARFDYAEFPGEGWNTAYTASPLYYTVTGIAARFVDSAVPTVDSLLTASRIASVGWAVVAAGLMWLLLGEFSIPFTVRFFTILLIATAPTVLHLTSIVNPDVTGLAGGAAIAWLTLRYERRASPAWLLTLVATLTILGKPLNAVAVGAMVGYLLIRYVQARRNQELSRPSFPTVGIAALIAGFLLGAVPWSIAQGALATVPALDITMLRIYSGATLTLADVTSQFTAVVSPLRAAYMPALVAGPLTALVALVADMVLLGGNIGVSMLSADRRASALATTTLVSAFLLGPTVVVFMFVTNDGFLLPATVRYGLPLLPLFAVGLAVAANTKAPARVLLGVLALASLAVITAEMIGVM